ARRHRQHRQHQAGRDGPGDRAGTHARIVSGIPVAPGMEPGARFTNARWMTWRVGAIVKRPPRRYAVSAGAISSSALLKTSCDTSAQGLEVDTVEALPESGRSPAPGVGLAASRWRRSHRRASAIF